MVGACGGCRIVTVAPAFGLVAGAAVAGDALAAEGVGKLSAESLVVVGEFADPLAGRCMTSPSATGPRAWYLLIVEVRPVDSHRSPLACTKSTNGREFLGLR